MAGLIPDFIDSEGSEFVDNLLQKILRKMYQGLWDGTNKLFGEMNGVLENGLSTARDVISKNPEEWNKSAYVFIQTVSEEAIVPIAAAFFTFLFCWQLISMQKESNRMHQNKPQEILIVLVTLAVCLVACAKSFDIVNGLFSIANWAVKKIPSGFTADSGTLTSLPLAYNLDTYGFGDVFLMFGNLVLTLLAKLCTYVIVVAIYVRVNVWYLELLMYMASSAIPFSTFINKEWGQVGMNYLRKMLAMTFEGFYMLLAFGMYQAIVGRVLNGFATTSDTYLLAMVTTIGCGVALFQLISKAGSISASVFNAH